MHAVAVSDGRVVAEAGDPGLVSFLRSSAKPFQALPLVRARDDLADEEIAIASASHLAAPEQLAAVRSLLAKAPAEEDELECGPEPTRVEHNCSGKHAGMLALCRAQGLGERRLPAGRRTRSSTACLNEIADAADVPADDVPTAVDGCGVLTFALAARADGAMFGGLEEREGGGSRGSRDARAPGADPRAEGGRHAADARARGAGRRRAAPRVCCARPGPAGSGSRSRWRTGTCARCGPRSPSCCAGWASRRASSASSRSRTPSARSSARSSPPRLEPVEIPLPTRRRFRCTIETSMVRAGRNRLFVCLGRSPSTHARKPRSRAHRRHRSPGGRGAPEARPAGTGEGLPHLRRDRHRARGGRAHEGADRGLLHLSDRPLDRARRGRAVQVAAARAAGARRGREDARRSST